MKREPLLYGVIGLLLGIIIAWSVSLYAVNGNHTSMMRAMGMRLNSNSSMTHNSETCNGLQCKVGE